MLWEHSPKALLYAVFFANGKNLCLRGGREHHTLKISQLVFGKEDKAGEVLEYVTLSTVRKIEVAVTRTNTITKS